MNLNFLCCIGAELKNSVQQTTRMTQVYLYRAFEEETIADMLATGFFNDALGIIRQDDLLLLYSPNETPGKYVYARVSSVGRDGVGIEKVNIRAEEIQVDTTGYTNLSGSNLQQILNNLDTLLTTMNNAFVKIDGTSIMTGPLKMRSSVSFKCAIAPSWDGVGFYKLNDNDSLTLMASMETTDGLCPAANNTYNLGKASHKWKDAHIARVITSVINNGYDIGVPATNGPDTFALKSEVDNAANSGRMITDQGVWYAKMYSASVVPTGAEYDGQNYADFSQVDGDNNPIIVIYEGQSGSWVEIERITPPANYDGYVPVTKKIWDIVEQTGQQGGRVLWNHQSKAFTPYPNIVDLSNVATTDLDNLTPTGEAKFTAKANTDMDNLTSTGQNIANWSSNVSNCITYIPQDIKLELNAGTLTLKAGSKAYNANGLLVTTTNDLNTTWATTGTANVVVTADGQNLYIANYPGETVSTLPSPTTSYKVYFNTTDGKCYFDDGTMKEVSFPVAVITANGQINNIQNTFNGFGYIGSTVFALPGVKWLGTDGRNTDGSLKSIVCSNSNVMLRTWGSDANTDLAILFLQGSIKISEAGSVINWKYYEKENYWSDNNLTSVAKFCALGYVSISGGKILSFNPRTVFHALDYNDTEYIAHQATPSDKYITNLFPTSITTQQDIVAPADGFVGIHGRMSSGYACTIYILGSARVATIGSLAGAIYGGAFFAVQKGAIIRITLSGGTFDQVDSYFVYANGAK